MADEEEPRLHASEDFLPEDPRDDVRVEFNGRLYRLCAGNMERPIADLDRLLMLAKVVDPVLADTHGFGLIHLAEVVLAHVDDVLTAAVFPDGPGHEVGDRAVTLTADEVGPDSDTFKWKGPHAIALDWLTAPATHLEYEPGSTMSAFGSTMLVVIHGESAPRWLPIGFLPEALAQATAELTEQVAIEDKTLAWRLDQAVAARVRRRLWRFSPVLYGAPDGPTGPTVSAANVAQWALPIGDRDLLVVQTNTAFISDELPTNVPVAVRAAEYMKGAGAEFTLPFATGQLALRPGAMVTAILVVAGAAHLIANGPPGALHLSLEDLDWIAQSANDDTDLFHFAEEMSGKQLPAMFGMETMNVWDWWQSNNSALFRSGRPPGAMMFELHRGTVEWQRAKRLSSIERALLLLGLPALRQWDMIDEEEQGSATVARWDDDDRAVGSAFFNNGTHRRPATRIVRVRALAVPVSLEAKHEHSAAKAELMIDLVGSFTHGISQVETEWTAAADASGIRGLRLTFEPVPGPDSFSIASIDRIGHTVAATIGVHLESLAEVVDGDPAAGRQLMAESFAGLLFRLGVPLPLREAVCAAWIAAPPTLTLDILDSAATRNDMQAPAHVELPLTAEIDRLIAHRVAESGVQPGIYPPTVAKQIDRDTIAPLIREMLDDRLAGHSADSLIVAGMVQLERTLLRREHDLRNLKQSAGAFPLTWDPVNRQHEIQEESLGLRRCIELIVEAALLTQPTGKEQVHERAWAKVLATSASFLDATTRSETLHYQVTRSGLDVSEMFDLSIIEWPNADGEPSGFDVAAYGRALAEEALHQSWLDADDGTETQMLLDAADQRFLDEYGTFASDALKVLFTLASWPLNDDDPDAVVVTEEQAIDRVTASGVLDDDNARYRAASALHFLQSRSDAYTAEEWVPWRLRTRRVRLLVKPVPVLSDGRMVIAPHYCHTAAKVFFGYWMTGMLPWSQTGSDALDRAMGAIRSRRNDELEKQADRSMRTGGWVTRSRVKPGDGHRIGVEILTTEIDIVAVRRGSRVIWVLEVKDPNQMFNPADIRRHIDRFHAGTKSYVSLLTRKLAEVSVNPSTVAQALGLPAGDYDVRSLFVTRHIVPAAFMNGPHPFVTADHLVDYLSGAEEN
ncbi:hypothetical protein [Cryobacterium levicorallinum]|uniref:hypothetical protein n=1 Tax=Cryobacterium levicorallinum TaxID=995038 RepID=UPI00106CFD50|nr:hypothetical protein [Cryobacterium levicorallinum]